MTPQELLTGTIRPTLAKLTTALLLPLRSPEAECALLAAALQETGLRTRLQEHGTARSFWQIDTGGLKAASSTRQGSCWLAEIIRAVLRIEAEIAVPGDLLLAALGDPTMDRLACAIARLLMWFDPDPLPALGDEEGAYQCYERVWQPGRPRPEDFPENYRIASSTVRESGSAMVASEDEAVRTLR